MAISLVLLSINIDGPEPEIPPPKAPACLQASFKASKPGINIERTGSIITSSKDLPIKS